MPRHDAARACAYSAAHDSVCRRCFCQLTRMRELMALRQDAE